MDESTETMEIQSYKRMQSDLRNVMWQEVRSPGQTDFIQKLNSI